MPISDLLAQITGEAQSSVPLSNQSQKRKANDDLERSSDKLVRRDSPVVNAANTSEQVKRPTKPWVPIITQKASVASAVPSKPSIRDSSNKTSSVTPPPSTPAKPPKKGSYAEILARAKAAQGVLGQMGKIQHKPIEKSLSKRERQELKEQEAQLHRGLKKKAISNVRRDLKDGAGERNGKSAIRQKNGKVSVNSEPLPEKKVKKAAMATTGYTGTARPNPTVSSKPVTSRPTGKDRYGTSDLSRRPAYDSEEDDEDEEDNEDDDEEGYNSAASSDMEAAVFEVDEEEERATRIARKEDEEARREEMHHQREKEEKRRRLAAMAKGRR